MADSVGIDVGVRRAAGLAVLVAAVGTLAEIVTDLVGAVVRC